MIIDAENQVVGRIAVFAAKHALLGENIDIVNCEKAMMTGSRKFILARFKQRRERGVPLQGPYYPRKPEMLVKRIIRGMLPYKKEKGETALKRIYCHIGVPAKLQGASVMKVEGADISKVPNHKYITIAEISKQMGAKV